MNYGGNTMKRIVSILLVVLVAAAVLAGCGGSDGGSGKAVDLPAILTKFNTDYSLSLEAVDTVEKLNRYYEIAVDDVKQFAAEKDTSDPNAPVELVLVEAVDSAAADRVESALKERYKSVLRQYTSYTPEKVEMVKACDVTKDGNFVSMIVCDNAPDMVKYFKESVK